MAAANKAVTALALIEALGGGSFRTIYKYLAEWEASRPKNSTATNTAEVPESVQNALLNTWRVATMEAAKEVIATKQKAAEEVKAAQDKFDEALEAIQKLEADSEQDNAQIEQLKARVAELEQSVSQLSNDNAAARATATQLQHQVKSLQTELDRAHKAADVERNLSGERLEKLSADHAAAQDKASKQIEQLQTAVADGQKKLEQTERDRLETALKLDQSEQKAQAAQQGRDQASKERDAAVTEAAELKGQSAALKAQNTELLAALAEPKRKGKTE
ncbi:MAG: DNA-binding protein [Candidatus Obscuribacterales bacterium]|nr:DNA-binding protein [Candidatus Obscuribacterales bacterium]